MQIIKSITFNDPRNWGRAVAQLNAGSPPATQEDRLSVGKHVLFHDGMDLKTLPWCGVSSGGGIYSPADGQPGENVDDFVLLNIVGPTTEPAEPNR